MPTYPTTGSTPWQATLKAYIDGTANALPVASQAGVDPTGVTDSTTGINNAVTAAGAGRTLYFGPGTYKTVAGLTMSLKQTWVLDPGALIQLDSAGSGHAVTISASGCTIVGGKIDASSTAFSCVFLAAGLVDIDVLDVDVSAGTYGVRCKGGTGAVTSRVRVLGCTIHGQSSHGVFFNWETQDSEIADNHIYSVTGNGIWVGNTSLRNRIANNSIVTSGRNGIEVFGGSTGASVVGNTLSGITTIGITLDTSDGSRVADNRIETTGSYGIELAASNKCVVEGNTMKAIGSLGFSISAASGTCNDNTIANNVVDGCATGGVFAGGGSLGAQRLRVLGNEIIDCATGNAAIACATGIGCTDWIISNNTVRWTTTVSSLASSTGINLNLPNTLVAGNLIVADAAITTAGGSGINLASTAIDCKIVGNTVIANSKLNKGIVIAATTTGNSVVGNKTTLTLQDCILNSSASTSNSITANLVSHGVGNGITMGGATGTNRRVSDAYQDHTGPNRFTGNLGFYGATPHAQGAALTATVAAAPAGGTGTAAGGWDTAGNRDLAIATINNLKTRVDQIEARLASAAGVGILP